MPNKDDPKESFAAAVRTAFAATQSEISERNGKIEDRDLYVYSDRLERSLDIPIGHDSTPVNWLRRTVEIHKNMFMSRGFQVISTYDTKDPTLAADEEDGERVKIENKKEKAFAETRKALIDSIIKDNGGFSLWSDLAEAASAVGDAAVKTYYDEAQDKFIISPIESIENLYVLWGKNDFREIDAVAYVQQVSKQRAIDEFGAPQDVATSPLGRPLDSFAQNQPVHVTQSSQPMVSILEVTGKIEGWGSENGVLKKVPIGKENLLNVKIIGDNVTKVIDKPEKLPKYYIFPNKRQRKRPWGSSDISEPAININLTYVETLSDWRTVSSKVNFPKYRAFGFGLDSQLPRSEPRKIQAIPMGEGQDLLPLDQGNPDKLDFRAQMEELKEQFVRETGVSRVLFDDPSVTLNSNQALLTSMKPTSDIAEAKKQLWGPIIEKLFADALETIGSHNKELSDIAGGDFTLKVQWPSVMQKEDPVFQQMILNRFNANTMSLQTYLEMQGDTKEEIDRIRDEMEDPLTAAILGRIVNVFAQNKVAPPSDKPPVKTTVNLRGDLTPQQEGNLATQAGFNDGPFPPSMGPQGGQGLVAGENQDNEGFLTDDPFRGGKPINRGPDGKPLPGSAQPKDTGTGQDARPQVNTQSNNQEGTGVAPTPGTGSAPASAQGAIDQKQQNEGA